MGGGGWLWFFRNSGGVVVMVLSFGFASLGLGIKELHVGYNYQESIPPKSTAYPC